MRQDRRRGGFTLVEMLCVIVVLLLVAALMTTGVQLAVRAFGRSVSLSEAQTLCATLKTCVSDELRYAGTIYYDADGKVTGFFSQNQGDDAAAGFTADADGHILLGGKKILPNKAYPYGARAAVTIDSYDTQTRIFHVTICIRDAADSTVLAETAFEVRQLNAPPGEAQDGQHAGA